MKNTIFTGAGVAIVTPMNDDYSINYNKLSELINWQIEQGIDAIVICGTTGESSTMTDEEHVECIKVAVKTTAGRVPVIAGAGSNDTAYAEWMSIEAETAGADALLHVTPYYNKASQRGLIKHFEAVAKATTLPIILYSVPSRTGMTITPATYVELAKIPNIVATKEASGDISAIAKIMVACEGKIDIYSGNDDQILPITAMGGKGVISVMANVMPKLTHDICQSVFDNDLAKARTLVNESLEVVNSLFMDVNPIPVKEALNIMGKNVGECRLPLCSMEENQIEVLTTKMTKFGLV